VHDVRYGIRSLAMLDMAPFGVAATLLVAAAIAATYAPARRASRIDPVALLK
jgi:ABC-type lipoprotein release transport system permease subunit